MRLPRTAVKLTVWLNRSSSIVSAVDDRVRRIQPPSGFQIVALSQLNWSEGRGWLGAELGETVVGEPINTARATAAAFIVLVVVMQQLHRNRD